MAKAVLKTSATNADVQAFLNSIEPDRRREDGLKLLDFMNRVTGLAPKMWGPSMVGYGRYAYKYESGREGEYFLTGFSPRKSSLTVYVMPGYRDLAEPLSRLGKHKLGKSCLYINKLADVEMDVLEEIVREGVTYMRANYETRDT
ncbi:MAG: DUF1801 domain-containing protein [Pseudomonadota bacterium]